MDRARVEIGKPRNFTCRKRPLRFAYESKQFQPAMQCRDVIAGWLVIFHVFETRPSKMKMRAEDKAKSASTTPAYAIPRSLRKSSLYMAKIAKTP